MSENTTPENAAQAPEATTPVPEAPKAKKAKHVRTEKDDAARGAFPTVEAAQAAKPDNPRFKIVRVTRPDGSVAFTWNDTPAWARQTIAALDGYKADFIDKPAVKATKDDVATAFGQLSPEDQAILIAKFVPAPTSEAAPKGKGKK